MRQGLPQALEFVGMNLRGQDVRIGRRGDQRTVSSLSHHVRITRAHAGMSRWHLCYRHQQHVITRQPTRQAARPRGLQSALTGTRCSG